MNNFIVPEQIYRWLVSIQVIQNQGIYNKKRDIILPNNCTKHIQNGYIISKIIKQIIKSQGNNQANCLNNIKDEFSNINKKNNWEFIWISFETIRIQFDNRIKDLILQGENTLIIEIIKQLYDKHSNKNIDKIKNIQIAQQQQNFQQTSLLKQNNNLSRKVEKNNTFLDIRKINLNKDPINSDCSLQFLIIILATSLNMSVQEILGLFAHQNKYLAHVLVKGINQDFTGVILFYNLLNKYYNKFKQFCQLDSKDAQSCLYAVKAGLISKNQQVAELTIQLLGSLGNIYQWFISEHGRGSTTLLLGMKRHPHLIELYFDLLINIVDDKYSTFFTQHFKTGLRDAHQLVEISTLLIRPISSSYIIQQLNNLGVINQWCNIAVRLSNQSLQYKLLSFHFFGEVMNYIPSVIQNNQQNLSIFHLQWKQLPLYEFLPFLNEIISILKQLADQRNSMAKIIYQIIIDIFQDIQRQQDKKQYLIHNLLTILYEHPKIPVNFIIQHYKHTHLTINQYNLIFGYVDLSYNQEGLIIVGQMLLEIVISMPILNFGQARLIILIAQKIIKGQQGAQFIQKVVKECLKRYIQYQTEKKNPKTIKQQPMYFIVKGNSQKYNKQQQQAYIISTKCSEILIKIIDKLTQLSRGSKLLNQIENQLLQASAIIRKKNNNVYSKSISKILREKLSVSKQFQQNNYDEYRKKLSKQYVEDYSKKRPLQASKIMGCSRYTGPDGLRKEFHEMIEKRKKEDEIKKIEQQQRMKKSQYKKVIVKKQLEKVNLLRGFGAQAEIKQDGFWNKFMKDENKQLQIYPTILIQPRDMEYIDNLLRKYHRLLRYLFLNYTSSMYTVKANVSFQGNKERKETISLVELIKLLKDYKLFFLTNNNEIQTLIRDLNVKLLNKRETNELDFFGFEQFIIQFCSIILTKPHTISENKSKGVQNKRKNLIHLSHLELLEQFFKYLRLIFFQKGENTSIFDQPQTAYFNEGEIIKQFNKKLELDPKFILPEGYKKVTDKIIHLRPQFSKYNNSISQSYMTVFEIFDQIIHNSFLNFHLIEPICDKKSQVRVIPQVYINVKSKLLEGTDIKKRALTSTLEKKTTVPVPKILEKKILSLGMKIGLSYVKNKDKLIGEQVAYVIDDMINAVERNRNTIQKEKIVNDISRKKHQIEQRERKAQQEKERKRKERKNELQRMRTEILNKNQKEIQDKRQRIEKQKEKKLSQQKRKKQYEKKYKEEQGRKIAQKKNNQELENQKKKGQEKKKKEDIKNKKSQFKEFNKKEIEKFENKLQNQNDKKKKIIQTQQVQTKQKQQAYKKLRNKIHQKDKQIIEIKQKMNEQINHLYQSQAITKIYQDFQPNLRALYQFLVKNTYFSLTEKKHNNEIILETWHHFNFVFQLSPLIISAKDLFSIFRAITKGKQMNKDYYIGLNYQQFLQGLLRIAIRHKSVFKKLSQKIKDDHMTNKQIEQTVQKDIQEKQRNEFDEPKQIDVKNLLKQEDIRKQISNHYGDISQVNPEILKALIYYLKIPRDAKGQQKRFREIISSKIKYNIQMTEQLKEKLNQQYSLASQSPKKKKKKLQNSIEDQQIIHDSKQNHKQQLQPQEQQNIQ